MKKVIRYALCIMLISSMVLISGCGSSGNENSGTENQNSQSMETTGGGDNVGNGPTTEAGGDTGTAGNRTDETMDESKGVLEDVADDVRQGAEDLVNGGSR